MADENDESDSTEPNVRLHFALKDGVLASRAIPISELSDELLELLFEQNPNWVCEHRPDWVRIRHPEKLQ